MFGFLKKKIKDSIESIKKVFKEEEEIITEKPGEEVEELKKETKAEKQIIEEEEIKVDEEIKELKEELKEAPPEEKPEIAEEIVEEEEKLEVLEEKEEIIKETEKFEKGAEKEIEETKKKEEELIAPIPEERKIVVEEPEPKPVVTAKPEGFFAKIFKKKKPKEEIKKKEPEKIAPSFAEKISAAILEKKLSEEEYERFFRDFEISMMESNIAYEVIQILRDKLKEELVEKAVKRGKVDETISKTIEETFRTILIEQSPEIVLQKLEESKKNGIPTKILFLGVNGVGKTTSLAKLCHWIQKMGYSTVLAASDTFRAASIEQLEKHASNLGVKVIKHKYGADPAAVAFDAIEHAKAQKINCVLIDSAGRQHTNQNLMDELAKLKRVAKPDFTIFVADALTGNDAVEQAREFGKIGFDSIILGKADVDQKGGAILSVSYVSGKPILFLGMGQSYEDLEAFDKEKVIKKIFG